MAGLHTIAFDGSTFEARHGELLLDAALGCGVALPHDCRAGHCGTCRVKLISGDVRGGQSGEAEIVHACQSRVLSDLSIERVEATITPNNIPGVLHGLYPVTPEVMEVFIRTDRPLPYLAGQYAQLRFRGFPSRPFSMTHALGRRQHNADGRSIWFHVRQMVGGQVSQALGGRIRPGHRVQVTGPFGSAYLRPGYQGPLILVATSTGFAPIWAIAAAALRENPMRAMVIIAGGRSIGSLYMWPALTKLARFPNVQIVPVCSTPQNLTDAVQFGRPTDFLPSLRPTDTIYVCGAPQMVEAVKARAAQSGATCHADPFLPSSAPTRKEGALDRVKAALTSLSGRRAEEKPTIGIRPRTRRPLENHGMAQIKVGSHFRSQNA